MAITRLNTPIKLTSKEVDEQYHGRWVLFQQPSISEPGLVHAYSDIGINNEKEAHETDYNALMAIVGAEFGGKALLVHGCKDRGRMNLHVDYPPN